MTTYVNLAIGGIQLLNPATALLSVRDLREKDSHKNGLIEGENMEIRSVIKVESLYIHIENNEELNFLKRILFERWRKIYKDGDSKEKEFVNKLYIELWKMEMTK